jgi:phosphohistidine swiveling domain-containing protein
VTDVTAPDLATPAPELTPPTTEGLPAADGAGAAGALPDFPIAWSAPADLERTWELDDMHTPFCLVPLAWDYAQLIADGFAYRYERLDVPIDMRAQVFNGYFYMSWLPLPPEPEHEALLERYVGVKREHTPLANEYWERAVPELRELYRWIADLAVDDLPAAELAEAWEGAWERAQRAWSIHFYAITGPYQVLDDLADLYESVIETAPPGEAMRLIQGTIDELVAVDVGMSRLTDLIAASPSLAAAIGANPVPSLEDLATLPGGQAFVVELRGFLDEHGHLGQGFDDFGQASWAEEPAMVLTEIVKRLEHPVEPAIERATRLAREADVLADAFRVRLADQPDRLAEFERLLALARQIGRITETHNYWIDRMAQARLRAFAMRVGARLTREGVIEQRDDVLYLRRADVPDLVRSPVDRRSQVAERKVDHARWRTLKPPAKVGKTSTEEPSGRFGGERFATEDEAIVRGTGASAGVVRGPARVVLGPDDFERVRPGDIIVAPSSNPSWVPLFTIAGGLVTNTGGVLSHAAVVAREFALPAVVGTGDATTRIADGQTVELDGTTGYVRLL